MEKIKIAVASGKGGTGKTLVSTNLFWAAQQSHKSVTLVDCDAEEPNVAEFISGSLCASQIVTQNIPVIDPDTCVMCGKCAEYCSYNAIVFLPKNDYIKVVEELCHDCGACLEACEIDAISEKKKQVGVVQTFSVNQYAAVIEARADVGVYSPVPLIKKAISVVEQNSMAILDAPPGISCPFIATVDAADFVVLVTEPTPFGLNDLKLSVETLQHLQKPFGVIVNRAGLGNREVYHWLNQNNYPLLMEIPFDREIARIYSEGNLLAEKIPSYVGKFEELLETIEKQLEQ